MKPFAAILLIATGASCVVLAVLPFVLFAPAPTKVVSSTPAEPMLVVDADEELVEETLTVNATENVLPPVQSVANDVVLAIEPVEVEETIVKAEPEVSLELEQVFDEMLSNESPATQLFADSIEPPEPTGSQPELNQTPVESNWVLREPESPVEVAEEVVRVEPSGPDHSESLSRMRLEDEPGSREEDRREMAMRIRQWKALSEQRQRAARLEAARWSGTSTLRPSVHPQLLTD